MKSKEITNPLTIADEFAQKIFKERRKAKKIEYAPMLVLAVLVLVFSIVADGFFSIDNVLVIFNQLALPLTLAVGATFVIIMGSIDLSVDGMMALGGCIISVLIANSKTTLDLGVFGIIITLLVGCFAGFLIGFIHVKLKIPSFIVTFGFTSIGAGLALISYGLVPANIKDLGFRNLALETVGIAPPITYISIAIFIIGLVLEKYTAFGRYVFAIGDNENIPRMTGIKVDQVKIKAFIWSGFCVALSGVMAAALLGRGDITMGKGNLFPALTAVVVGGTSMSGGRGGMVNTLIGALIVTVLRDGLVLLGVSPYIQTGINGLIIVIAVAYSAVRGKRIIIK